MSLYFQVVPLLASFAVTGLALAAAIHCYCLHVVVQCAQYFRDMEPIKKSLRCGYSADLTDPRMFGVVQQQSTQLEMNDEIGKEEEEENGRHED